MRMRSTEGSTTMNLTKIQSDIATLEELWEELFTNTLAGKAGFEEPGDAILLSFDAGVYQAYINLIAEYVTSPSADAEVVIDRAISMASVLKHLEEVLNRAYVPFEDIEWISWLINQSRSTLFSIMLKSQEFIMGE